MNLKLTYKLKIRGQDKNIFEAIKSGKKKIETRAATGKYRTVKEDDILEFFCGKDKFRKKVKSAEIFKTIGALLKKYKLQQINPNIKIEKELWQMYCDFPNYREKIKKYGLVAWRLK